MNVVYLSPHFPPNFKFFCFALRANGARVLGVGDAPYWEVAEDLRGTLTEYWHVPEMDRRPSELRHAVAQLINRYGPVHRIDSNNEHWLAHEADLREAFDILGQRPADLARNRSKTGMKEVFRSAGVPVAEGERVRDAEHLRAFVKTHDFPVVIKPNIGVGAHGASRINTPAELDAICANLPPDMIVEDFIRGRIITYDGIADRAGTPIFETSHLYSSGIMEIATGQQPIHYYSLRDLPPKLVEYGRAALKAFGIRERFFHFEFFLTDKGDYFALEVNVRPPGGYTTDLMNYSAGVDLYTAWAKLLLHGENKLDYERKFFTAHVGRRAGVAYRRSTEEVLKTAPVAFIHHPPMPRLWSNIMGDECFLIGCETEEQIQHAIAFIEAPG